MYMLCQSQSFTAQCNTGRDLRGKQWRTNVIQQRKEFNPEEKEMWCRINIMVVPVVWYGTNGMVRSMVVMSVKGWEPRLLFPSFSWLVLVFFVALLSRYTQPIRIYICISTRASKPSAGLSLSLSLRQTRRLFRARHVSKNITKRTEKRLEKKAMLRVIPHHGSIF